MGSLVGLTLPRGIHLGFPGGFSALLPLSYSQAGSNVSDIGVHRSSPMLPVLLCIAVQGACPL